MNPYQQLVSDYARNFRDGRGFPLGGFAPAPARPLAPNAPKALIFSPHPDDECIIGALPLRLRRQSGWNIVNVAVTQGSNVARQDERWQELQKACDYIGFNVIQTAPRGLEKVNPKTRTAEPARWQSMVAIIAEILRREAPKAIFFPHEHDWNSSHIGVHFLVMDALKTLGSNFTTQLVETEYWGQMTAPNLMVESVEADVTDLVTGTSFHVGEVRRNPFHLLLPAWMQDNVRRGSELVGGQGQAAPNYGFATLYRHRVWNGNSVVEARSGGTMLGNDTAPDSLFA